MNLDTGLALASAILLAPLVVLLIFRRVAGELPVFVAYQGYSLLACAAGAAVSFYAPDIYLHHWVLTMTVDTLFDLCVIAELGRNLLRYNRSSDDPADSPAFAVVLFLLFAQLGWQFAGFSVSPSRLIDRLAWIQGQATAILELAAFLALVVWSAVKKMRWPDRELRIATGMGVWAFVAFCVLLLRKDGFIGLEYQWISRLTAIVCLFVILYWLYYFWTVSQPVTNVLLAGERRDHARRASLSATNGRSR